MPRPVTIPTVARVHAADENPTLCSIPFREVMIESSSGRGGSNYISVRWE